MQQAAQPLRQFIPWFCGSLRRLGPAGDATPAACLQCRLAQKI